MQSAFGSILLSDSCKVGFSFVGIFSSSCRRKSDMTPRHSTLICGRCFCCWLRDCLKSLFQQDLHVHRFPLAIKIRYHALSTTTSLLVLVRRMDVVRRGWVGTGTRAWGIHVYVCVSRSSSRPHRKPRVYVVARSCTPLSVLAEIISSWFRSRNTSRGPCGDYHKGKPRLCTKEELLAVEQRTATFARECDSISTASETQHSVG